jgi:hypothetical protein
MLIEVDDLPENFVCTSNWNVAETHFRLFERNWRGNLTGLPKSPSVRAENKRARERTEAWKEAHRYHARMSARRRRALKKGKAS